MGQGRPTGATYGAAHASIDLDLAALQAAPNVARAAGQGVARELQEALKVVQNEQKIAIEGAKQATAAVRAQQSQITATSRAESAERISAAQAESIAKQQIAKADAAAAIEEERRKTAAFKAEIREREQANRQAQVSANALRQGSLSFAGALFGGPAGGVAGALAGGGAAGVGLAGGLALRAAVNASTDAAATATAYDRQELAAIKLAGSQAKLNSMMTAYDNATGGAIDEATKLADVTNLQAIGFAHNAAEVERFTRAARGISIAKGLPLGEVVNELALGIANQSTRRFDQLGLSVAEVNQRIEELRENNRGLTREAAFQEAVLQIATEKYAGLTKSLEAQATGSEKAAKAVADLKLAFGQLVQEPVGYFAGNLAKEIDALAERVNELKRGVNDVKNAFKDGSGGATQRQPAASRPMYTQSGGLDVDAIFHHNWLPDLQRFIASSAQMRYGVDPQRLAPNLYGPQFKDPTPSWMTSVSTVPGAGGPFQSSARFDQAQTSAIVEWNNARLALERQTNEAIVSEERAYGRQRQQAIANYNKQIAREAEDWATQRARSEEDLQERIGDVAISSARQRERWERDLARSISQAQSDSAEKVADLRSDANKRLVEIEENYAEDREKAALDHSDKLLDAAGRLDAKAIYEEQRNYADQAAEARKAHDKQVNNVKEQLEERLAEEAKSLLKSITQQRAAMGVRLADQAEEDRLRVEEMKAQATKENARAEADRATRLGRMAQDQQDQLTAMDNAHADRMQQIHAHAEEEYQGLKDQYDQIFSDLGMKIDGHAQKVAKTEEDAIKAFDNYWLHMEDVINGKVRPKLPGATTGENVGIPGTPSSPAGFAEGGWVRGSGFASVHAGEFMLSRSMLAGRQPVPASVRNAITNNSRSSSIVFHPNSVVIQAAPGDDTERLVDRAIDKITERLEAAA